MKDRKAEMNSRYATKRKGSMSPGQLHKASERTKKRALAIRRKKKVEEESMKKFIYICTVRLCIYVRLRGI